MNRVDNLRAGRQSYAVKLQEFLRISARRPDSCVAFFEGEDAKYYWHRIDLLCPGITFEGIDCDGRDNVLKLFELIGQNARFRRTHTLYFIDRDFSDSNELPSAPHLYVTPCYSVENLYVNEQTFRRILKYELEVNEHAEGDDTFDRCIKSFNESLSSFQESTVVLNGWVLAHRIFERKTPTTTRMNLNSLNLNQFVRVGLNVSYASYTVDDLRRVTNAVEVVDHQAAFDAGSSITPEARGSKFRGKFQGYFFRKYLAKLIEDANSSSPTLFATRRTVSLHVSDSNLLSELCQYAETPLCLREFLSGVASRLGQQAASDETE